MASQHIHTKERHIHINSKIQFQMEEIQILPLVPHKSHFTSIDTMINPGP